MTKKCCFRCSTKKLPRHLKWFELYGLSYGENSLGLPEHLLSSLPATFCSSDCLMEYIEDVIRQGVDNRYEYNAGGKNARCHN